MSIDIEEAGNPRRKTKDEEVPNGEATEDDSPSDASSRSASTGRKTRISVTPRDPDRLEEVASDLGIPKSKVYNMGFQALLEKFGME